MLTAVWLLLAAQLGSKTIADDHISDVRTLFVADDVPAYLMHEGEVYRTVYTRTTVREDGSFENCAVEFSSGDKKLDLYTCALIAKRAKMHPVKWIDGAAVYSVLRFPVVWLVTEGGPPEPRPSSAADLDLTVNRLPKGSPKILDVLLEVRADESGRIVSCGELPPSKRDRTRHFPELIPTICAQAAKSVTLRPPLDRAGRATRSVQTAVAQLRLAP